MSEANIKLAVELAKNIVDQDEPTTFSNPAMRQLAQALLALAAENEKLLIEYSDERAALEDLRRDYRALKSRLEKCNAIAKRLGNAAEAAVEDYCYNQTGAPAEDQPLMKELESAAEEARAYFESAQSEATTSKATKRRKRRRRSE